MPVIHKARPHVAPASNWPAITRLSVENLFGRYSYPNLNFRPTEENDVALLYGDNGVGKTTILKLIYSCLSPMTNEGNRTHLSKTPFSKLKIFMLDGSEVEVTKDDGALVGSYTFRINEFRLHVAADKAHTVRSDNNPRVDSIADELRKIKLDILFLADDRTIRSTYDIFSPAKVPPELSDVDVEFSAAQARYIMAQHSYIQRRRLEDVEQSQTVNLAHVITAVVEWLSRKTRQKTSSGDENASNVYLNVVKALSARGKTREVKRVDRASLVKPLRELEASTKNFQTFGLVGAYPLAEFIKIVNEAPDERIPDIESVLSPYIDSLITRLNALDEVQLVMSTFQEELNSYLRDKSVSLHVDHELRFFDDKRTNISPSDLSSGERQLLFLFCAALMSRDGNSLFMIDEPELSLNVKWQRRLVSSLAKLASGAATQFIMATHSIEILSQHRRSVIQLN